VTAWVWVWVCKFRFGQYVTIDKLFTFVNLLHCS
jgi:hypothetical protein